MSRHATPERFNGSWYANPPYQRFQFHGTRATVANNRFAQIKGSKILVAGCGFGYLVDELIRQGFANTYGCDIPWAIEQGRLELPHIANRLIVADVTIRSQLNALKTAAGLTTRQSFALAITEDLLPAADNVAEAQTMLTELRRISSSLFHIITMMQPGEVKNPDGSVSANGGIKRDADMLWLTAQEWRSVIGAEAILDNETGAIL